MNKEEALDFKSAIAEVERRVSSFSSTTVTEGEKIDNVFKTLTNNIANSKDNIRQIEIDIKSLDNEIAKLAPDKAQYELSQEAKAAKKALEEEKLILAKLESQVKSTKEQHISFSEQLRNTHEKMFVMQQAGKDNTSEFKELGQEAARLSGAISNVNAQTQVLAHNQSGFQGVISAVGAVASAFSVTQEVIKLFSGESENLQNIMLKVQSLMAITIGLQQVSSALHKTSAFQLVIVAKAKTTLATATNGLSKSLGISTIAAQALMATLTLGASVAITALIALWDKFSSAQKKAREEMNKFGEKAVESAYKPLSEFERLRQEWDKLGENLSEKEKFIRKNKKVFESLGTSIENVADAEKLLIDHKDSFIESIIAKAQATAAMELAAEKYKESMIKMREADAMEDTKTKVFADGSGTYQSENKAKTKKTAEAKRIANEARSWITKSINETEKGNKILAETNIKSIDILVEGSVEAMETAIAEKKKALKKLTNSSDYKKALKEIEKDQKALDAITGGNKKKTKEPFTEMLEKRKKQYQLFTKWTNSGDDVVAEAAQKEFTPLLKEGDNYIDYLKKKRDKVLQSGGDSGVLNKLNDEIANESKNTVIQTFSEDLQNQLDNTHSVLEMLTIIEEKRKTLANDNSDLDNNKKDIIDNYNKKTLQKEKVETDKLLEDYSSYLTKKLQMEEQYSNDLFLLQNRLDNAQTEDEKKKIQEVIDERKKIYQKDSAKSWDEDYDKLVEAYQNFEQKKSAISSDFEEKRRVAKKHGNEELIIQLTKAEQKALSKLALDELSGSSDWDKLLGNLDDLTSKKIKRLITKIEADKLALGVEFDPKDIEAIMSKLNSAKDVLQTRNPFKSLINGIKEFSKASDEVDGKKTFENIFESAGDSFKFLKGSLDSVVGGLTEMGLAGDAVTQQLIGDISKMLGAAGELASGIADGNPLAVVQGSVNLLTSAFNIFNSKDRKKEREIIKHKKAVDTLKEAYQDLEREVNKALGGDEYKNQQQMISNLSQQQEHFSQAAQAERDKKKTDKGKVKEFEQAYKEAGQKIEDLLESITQDILQTNAKDAASQLGNSLVEAFGKGEDAATAFGQTANNIMKQAVLNQLKKNFLEKQLEKALDDLEESMGYRDGNDFVFDGLTEAEQQNFKNQISSIGASFGEALKVYEDLFKNLTEEEFDTSLSGAVKGVSEETASLVAGQMNAIRINQIEAVEIIREQLIVLNQIASNTSFNFHLTKLNDILNILKVNYSSDYLRAEGL